MPLHSCAISGSRANKHRQNCVQLYRHTIRGACDTGSVTTSLESAKKRAKKRKGMMTLLLQTVSWTDLTPNQCAEMWCSQACINFIRETQIGTTVDEQYNKRATGTTTDCWNRWRNKGLSHERCSKHHCVPVPPCALKDVAQSKNSNNRD